MINLILPLVIASAIGAVTLLPHKKVSPVTSAVVAATTLALGALASIPILFHLSVQGIVTIPVFGNRLHKFLHLDGVHVSTRGSTGFIAIAVSLVVTVRIIRLLIERWRLYSTHPGGTLILSDPQPYAYVLPGRQPAIVVSQGLIDFLSPAEIQVVLHHEEAHIKGRHDRWKLLGSLCTMINPLLVPVHKQLECALERMADDSAALACGSRRMVAAVITKLALQHDIPAPSLGVAATSIVTRVRSLTNDTGPVSVLSNAYAWVGTIVMAFLCALQWHHVVKAVASACGL